MSGTVKLPHTCPNCCKTVARTFQELEQLFGFRHVPQGLTSQSWCRVCRSKQ